MSARKKVPELSVYDGRVLSGRVEIDGNYDYRAFAAGGTSLGQFIDQQAASFTIGAHAMNGRQERER